MFESHSKRVSILSLSRLADVSIQTECFSSVLGVTNYTDFEIIALFNNITDLEAYAAFKRRWPFKMLESTANQYNWSSMNNQLAQLASGRFLLFLNDDVKVLSPKWLNHMVALAERPEVGAVGAVLLYPDMTIQHAGLFLKNEGSGADHILRHCRINEVTASAFLKSDKEVSSVTGACLMVRKELFLDVGGFDESFPIVANDTDFCLRLIKRGFRNVLAVKSFLIHYEAISRAGIPENEDVARFKLRWNEVLRFPDPYYGYHFDKSRADFEINTRSEPLFAGIRNSQINAEKLKMPQTANEQTKLGTQ